MTASTKPTAFLAMSQEEEAPDQETRERVEAMAEAILAKLVEFSDTIASISTEEAVQYGMDAAQNALTAARWSQIVGERINTTEATKLLGVTRQALAQRQHSGSLLGLPGQSTTWYPTWQFNTPSRTIRPEVRDMIEEFRNALGERIEPFLIAAWATNAQHEDLDGYTPAEWLAEGRSVEQLIQAAQRAAARQAQ